MNRVRGSALLHADRAHPSIERAGTHQFLDGVRKHLAGYVVHVGGQFHQRLGRAAVLRMVGVGDEHLQHIGSVLRVAATGPEARGRNGPGGQRTERRRQRAHQRHTGGGGEFLRLVEADERERVMRRHRGNSRGGVREETVRRVDRSPSDTDR